MNIPEQKRHLRDSINERIARMSDKDRRTESRSLCKRILELLPQDILTIAAYVPLKSEADILPALQQLLDKGCHVYLPVFKQNSNPLTLSLSRRERGYLAFRTVQHFDQLIIGPLNIPEPPDSALELDPQTLNIALVPARAFDRKGFRLGRGNGGYDRWIREQRIRNPETIFWGIALECQVVNEVPREEHDEKVDAVITARGFVSPLPRGEGFGTSPPQREGI